MNVKNHDFPRGLGVPLLCVQGINNVTKADVILVMFYERIDKDRVFELNSSDYSIASIKYVFYDHLGEFVAYALGSELNGNVFDEQSREIAKYNLKATKTENKNSKICNANLQ